ncbi:hypothetical protein [Flavobacterium sp. LHD-85]|uniref:hypothetical protein n=1 Tax=Flavobacterium sp. LHD-85 TaxID=3071410 RepID=UPI0027E10EF8|nr:hypothetical protein [Flavobacterium sp. LHD-85]MDQ6531036.1 hypothetical protein [Flavobacterium sp. LHD-85]
MKNKTLPAIMLGLLTCPVFLTAQINDKAIRNLPAHIVWKVQQISTLVNLSEEQQSRLGRSFFIKDSLANKSLASGESLSKLAGFYNDDSQTLKTTLTPYQYDCYEFENNNSDRFLTALKFAADLQLNPDQINKIRKQKDVQPTEKLTDKKEIIAFYNSKLSSILTKEQYVSLLQITYRDKSKTDAKKDWERIKQLNLITDKNNGVQYAELEKYHLLKNSYLDADSEQYDKKKLAFETEKIALQEPPLLIRANILSAGEYKNNTYSTIIKYERDIKLTSSQTDSILSKYKQLVALRFENEERDLTSKLPIKEPSEYENVIKILTTEQIDIWLASKNKNQSLKVAQKNWKKLEMEGLIKGLNQDAVVKEFAAYQLQFLIADEKARMYNTSEYSFYRRDIEQKKPELLKKLDLIARNKSKGIATKNELTW